MKIRFVLFILLMPGVALWLSACGLPTPQPRATIDLSTQIPSPSPSPTLTIQWFPPTKTPTALVTRTILPTPDQRPGIGTQLIQDNFENPQLWQTTISETGNVAFGNSELSIAIAAPKSLLSSLRSDLVLDDFYLEVTAAPSLCRGRDAYGILLRTQDEYTYYRFAVSCDGMARFERVKNGSLTVIQDWLPSGQIPIGAPSILRLGVWAQGAEMRFFIGDVYQFSLQNLTWLSGQIGVFARSEGTTALTVSFRELAVYYLDAGALSATPSAPSPIP